MRRLGDTCLNWACLHNSCSLKSGFALLLCQHQSFWHNIFCCQSGRSRKVQKVQKSAEKQSGLHMPGGFPPLEMRCRSNYSRHSFLRHNLWRMGKRAKRSHRNLWACFGVGCYIEMATSYHQPSEHRLVGGWKRIFRSQGDHNAFWETAKTAKGHWEKLRCRKTKKISVASSPSILFLPWVAPKGTRADQKFSMVLHRLHGVVQLIWRAGELPCSA